MTRALALSGVLPRTYGRMTVDRWMALDAHGVHLHVFLDGEDVMATREVWCADDERGRVEVYLEREGRKYRDDDGRPARATLRGRVEIKEVRHDGRCRVSAHRVQ